MVKKLYVKKVISMSESGFWSKIPQIGGIYLIHTYIDKTPKKINRLLGIDDEGILYIGKSKNIRERVRMLWRVMNPQLKATAHTFGTKYNENKMLRKSFPLNSLFISFRFSNMPKEKESKLLKRYFLKFGEVPPFNSSK
jgi:hypothetical protein